MEKKNRLKPIRSRQEKTIEITEGLKTHKKATRKVMFTLKTVISNVKLLTASIHLAYNANKIH